jgi:hypothetical protein
MCGCSGSRRRLGGGGGVGSGAAGYGVVLSRKPETLPAASSEMGVCCRNQKKF